MNGYRLASVLLASFVLLPGHFGPGVGDFVVACFVMAIAFHGTMADYPRAVTRGTTTAVVISAVAELLHGQASDGYLLQGIFVIAFIPMVTFLGVGLPFKLFRESSSQSAFYDPGSVEGE